MRTFGFAALALLSSCATPGTTVQIDASEVASTTSLPTREYFDAVTSYHLFAIRAGELAVKRSTDPFTREYGARMIAQHSAFRAELAAAGRKHGLQLASTLHPSHAPWLSQLVGADGAVLFDATYPRNQMSAHEAGRRLHGAYALYGDIAELRRIAARLMAVAEEHERMMRMRPLGSSR